MVGYDAPNTVLLTKASEHDGVEGLTDVVAALRGAELLYRIGERDADPEHMFGLVSDVTVQDGVFYTLDARFSELRRYRVETGALQGRLGGPGEGPAELHAPENLHVVGEDVVAVSDPQRVAVKVLALRADTLKHLRTIRHRLPMAATCVRDSTIYVHAIDPKSESRHTIHAFTLQGEKTAAFGAGYRSESPVLSLQLSSGPIACVCDKSLVVTAQQGTPMLYGYSAASGERRWVTRVEDYRPVHVEVRGQATRFRGEDRSDSITRRLTVLPTGDVLVQVMHRTPQSKRTSSWSRIDSYVLSADTGNGVYVGSDLPPIYDADARHLYAATEIPYPQVQVWRVDWERETE
jgi:outer membrane protein assembly factor BamB